MKHVFSRIKLDFGLRRNKSEGSQFPIPCLAFSNLGKSMGVKLAVLADGQPQTAAFTVPAQLCGPYDKTKKAPSYSPKWGGKDFDFKYESHQLALNAMQAAIYAIHAIMKIRMIIFIIFVIIALEQDKLCNIKLLPSIWTLNNEER